MIGVVVVVHSDAPGKDHVLELLQSLHDRLQFLLIGEVIPRIEITMTEDKVKHYGAKDKIKEDKIAMREAGDLGRAVVRRIKEKRILEEYAASQKAG